MRRFYFQIFYFLFREVAIKEKVLYESSVYNGYSNRDFQPLTVDSRHLVEAISVKLAVIYSVCFALSPWADTVSRTRANHKIALSKWVYGQRFVLITHFTVAINVLQ